MRSKKEDTNKNNGQINIRVAVKEKKRFQQKANQLGITLTELIISLLKGQTPPDREKHRSMYMYLTRLTKEMNQIGNNINQVTTVIHQTKNNEKIEIAEFKAFNSLLSEYNFKRENLKEAINKLMFP